MRKAASTRVFWEADLQVARGEYVAAGQKASAERPAELLLDGSPMPIEQWANRLRALSSALSRGNNEETRHRAGQIAELKAG